MKVISFCISIFYSLCGFSQEKQNPADTLIPIQHKRDTQRVEPKLEGGALIDTINTKDKKFKFHSFPGDSLQKHPSSKKDSLK